MAVGVRLFQNRERSHISLSNYRINNQYGRLHKNHRLSSHFCDSSNASRIAFAGRRGLTANESKIVFESDFGGNLSARLPQSSLLHLRMLCSILFLLLRCWRSLDHNVIWHGFP